ncbi:MAG: NADH-quinone oxidoreductase subunit A [Verrucomicrobiia bacterium]|jgi:NADH-quinone oxidoreductase subunit A
MELQQYVGVLLMIALAFACVVGMLVGSVVVGKVGKRNKAKDTAYECGIEPAATNSSRYPVKFYLAAMLFILFDVEVVFFYPWAVSYASLLKNSSTASLAFFSMATFIIILTAAFYYSLKKGVFDFKK